MMDEQNALTPPGPQSGPPSPIGPQLQQPQLTPEQLHDQLSSLFDKSREMQTQFKGVDAAVSGLQKLGASVTQEDVLKAMGKLIADGHSDPRKMVQLSMDMPPGGAALAAWVQQRRQQVDAQMTQANQMHEASRDALHNVSTKLLLRHIILSPHGGRYAPGR